MKKQPDRAMVEHTSEVIGTQLENMGIKILNWYWTLGCYDTVFIFEAPDEKDALKVALVIAEFVTSETLVAIPREEAIKLV